MPLLGDPSADAKARALTRLFLNLHENQKTAFKHWKDYVQIRKLIDGITE
jgi:hypothetical protein